MTVSERCWRSSSSGTLLCDRSVMQKMMDNDKFGLPSLSPFSISLCILIRGYLNPGEYDPSCSWQLRQIYGNSLLRIIRVHDSIEEPSVVGLLQLLQAFMHRMQQTSNNPHVVGLENEFAAFTQELQSSLQHQLAMTSQSPEGLAALFDAIACMVTTSTNMRAEESIGADDNSVMGFFLRRCWADFSVRSFADQCALMEDLRRHVAQLDATPGLRPRPAIEHFISKFTSDMHISVGADSREEIEKPLKELAQRAPRLPDTELTLHQSAVLHGDVTAAIDRSHAYFNREHPRLPHVGVVGTGEQAVVPKERQRLQAAALQLAVTHARLGQVKAALRALSEAMRTAQQANDDSSLAHALAVLCQVTEAATPGSIDVPAPDAGATAAGRHQAHLYKLLQRLLDRSRELGLPHLVAYSRLSLAKFRLLHPLRQQPWHQTQPEGSPIDTTSGSTPRGGTESFVPGVDDGEHSDGIGASTIEVSRAVRFVSHLELFTQVSSSTPVPPNLTSGMAAVRVMRGVADMFVPTQEAFHASLLGSQAPCAEEVRQLAGTAPLLRAANWTIAGNSRLGDAHTLAFLASRASIAKAQDVITAMAQLATSLAASHGFTAAESVLALVDQRYPKTQSKALMAARVSIAQERALRRLELDHATALAARLTALASPDDSTNIALRLEAEERVVQTLLAGGQYPKAEKAAHKLFNVAYESGEQRHALGLLLLIGKIHLRAGSPVTAMPYVVSCMQQCKELEADGVALEAAVVMTEVWWKLGVEHLHRARHELDAVLGSVLAHGSLDLKCRAQVLWAELIMASHTTADTLSREHATLEGILEDAIGGFMAIEDWQQTRDAYGLLAVLYKGVEETDKCEDAAAVYAALQKEQRVEAVAEWQQRNRA